MNATVLRKPIGYRRTNAQLPQNGSLYGSLSLSRMAYKLFIPSNTPCTILAELTGS